MYVFYVDAAGKIYGCLRTLNDNGKCIAEQVNNNLNIVINSVNKQERRLNAFKNNIIARTNTDLCYAEEI